MILQRDYCNYDGPLLCYRLEELAAGRSTIMGLAVDFENGATPQRLGDSLVDVLRAAFADRLRSLEEEYARPVVSREGAVDRKEVEAEQAYLALVEDFQAAVTERKRLKLVP
jgi:hypothetical protein